MPLIVIECSYAKGSAVAVELLGTQSAKDRIYVLEKVDMVESGRLATKNTSSYLTDDSFSFGYLCILWNIKVLNLVISGVCLLLAAHDAGVDRCLNIPILIKKSSYPIFSTCMIIAPNADKDMILKMGFGMAPVM